MQEILSKKKIGERIKAIRLEQNHSQAFVANILNISRSNYSQIEIGNQFPSFESLSKIASYYSKSYDWILHGQESADYIRHSDGFSKELPASQITSTKKVLHVTESAQYLKKLRSESYLKQLPAFDLPASFTIDDGHYRAFSIKNNILKYINPDDVLIGRFIKNLNEVAAGRTYVIVTTMEIIFCEIENISFEEETIYCKNDRTSHAASILPFNHIQEVWEAVGKYSRIIQSVIEELETTVQSFQTLIQRLEHEVETLAKKTGEKAK